MLTREVSTWTDIKESDLKKVTQDIRGKLIRPALIILNGEVGAGKTTFTKYFIDNGQTFSPTYSIISETDTVLHADFYRLNSPEEITHLELDLYIEEKEYIFIEWGKNYLKDIIRNISVEFTPYEILIEITSQIDRKITLFELV